MRVTKKRYLESKNDLKAISSEIEEFVKSSQYLGSYNLPLKNGSWEGCLVAEHLTCKNQTYINEKATYGEIERYSLVGVGDGLLFIEFLRKFKISTRCSFQKGEMGRILCTEPQWGPYCGDKRLVLLEKGIGVAIWDKSKWSDVVQDYYYVFNCLFAGIV